MVLHTIQYGACWMLCEQLHSRARSLCVSSRRTRVQTLLGSPAVRPATRHYALEQPAEQKLSNERGQTKETVTQDEVRSTGTLSLIRHTNTTSSCSYVDENKHSGPT
ncbi:jg7913 [Pararge aegeria aegeria]|uniref:Jg7913 protein n=1 Tax=Pararge aegeria aegeria TaxID=348720 RepID=A0A8S4R2N3_9NEOP|nr:jg7913 [Pararge aegeria aegeria]